MADNHKLKLIYFDFRGKAEPLRWILHYGKADFEDIRIPELPHYLTPEAAPKFDELKSKLPFHQLPVLQENGQYLGQTQAIARYLGAKFGLTGTNDWEAAQIDALAAYFFGEVEPPLLATIRQKDPSKKATMQDEYKLMLPRFLLSIQGFLEKNGGPFLFGNTPSWMDFIVANLTEWLKFFCKEVLDDHTLIQKHYEAVVNLPGVKEWIANRPNQPF